MRVVLAVRAEAERLAGALRELGHDPVAVATELSLHVSKDDAAIGALRERLRRKLDQTVDSFDPDLIHAEGLTFWGQLASETGVPYVVTLVADDLRHAEGSRLRELAEQGAENARRVIVPAELEAASKRLLGGLENVVTAPWWPDDLAPLAAIYRAAIERPA